MSNNIDSSGILSICSELREKIQLLDKTYRLTKLRFECFKYQNVDSVFKLLESMSALSVASNSIVYLIDRLHAKLASSLQNSLDYHIATQQLNFYTSEWCDVCLPKLNEICQLASKNEQSLTKFGVTRSSPPLASIKQSASPVRVAGGQGINQLTKSPPLRAIVNTSSTAKTEVVSRVRRGIGDALLRLQQSMFENEKLISVITANVEVTRETIDAIRISMDITKQGLDDSGKNLDEAIAIKKSSNKFWSCIVGSIIILALILLIMLLRFLAIL